MQSPITIWSWVVCFPYAHVICSSFVVVPEHTKLKMPALSPTMTQGNIASWTKKVGDKVKPGETMAEVSMLDQFV